jgi:hypothetical protein
MANVTKGFGALMVLTLVAHAATAQPAPPVTADIAKKCREMATKAHRSATPGSKPTGAEKAQRDYFRECVAKGGKMQN